MFTEDFNERLYLMGKNKGRGKEKNSGFLGERAFSEGRALPSMLADSGKESRAKKAGSGTRSGQPGVERVGTELLKALSSLEQREPQAGS